MAISIGPSPLYSGPQTKPVTRSSFCPAGQDRLRAQTLTRVGFASGWVGLSPAVGSGPLELQQSQLTWALCDTAEVAQPGDGNYTDLSCQPRAPPPQTFYQLLAVFREPFPEF